MIAGDAAPASVLQAHRVLSAALRQAVRWQVLAVNPAAAIHPPRPERPQLRIPTAEETRKLLDAARDTVYEVPFTLAATCGLRRGEVLGLHWSGVDLDAGIARIRTTLQQMNGTARFVPPKTASSRRSVHLSTSTVALLRRHRASQSARRLLVGAGWHDEGLVVDRGDGEHLPPDSLGAAFARIAGDVGLPEVRLHDLRHGFATTLLAAGVNVKAVSAALGHSSSSFTLDTYAHVLPSMGEEVARTIENALGEGGT